MTTTARVVRPAGGSVRGKLNTTWHKNALWVFLGITLLHWMEHLVQAFQIWALGWARPDARGVLGVWFPFVVKEEWLHYFYAIVMLAGLLLVLPGMTGRARTWWTIAVVIQFWHHIEHLLLLIQAIRDTPFWGKPVPTSVAQLAFERVELHLFYNAVVFVPMLVAMYLHRVPPKSERDAPSACSCRIAAAT